MMKTINIKTLTLFAIFGTAALLGCKKLAEKTEFDMEYNQTFVVESSAGVDLPFDILMPETETNSEGTFAVNDTRKDLIEEILLNYFTLEVTSPIGEDFSFLKSMSIYISAEGLSEVRVAWVDEVPEPAGNFLDLNITTNDLKEYIKKDEFNLRVRTVTDEFIASDHEIHAASSFHVDAEILGQ